MVNLYNPLTKSSSEYKYILFHYRIFVQVNARQNEKQSANMTFYVYYILHKNYSLHNDYTQYENMLIFC